MTKNKKKKKLQKEPQLKNRSKTGSFANCCLGMYMKVLSILVLCRIFLRYLRFFTSICAILCLFLFKLFGGIFVVYAFLFFWKKVSNDTAIVNCSIYISLSFFWEKQKETFMARMTIANSI